MIGITQHTFKQQSGLIELFGICQTCARQRLHQPKGAHVKSAFLSWESVNPGLRRITMHKAVADEASMARTFKDSVYGAEHPRIGWSHEEDERHNKERRVQVLAAVKLKYLPNFKHPRDGFLGRAKTQAQLALKTAHASGQMH